METVTISLDYPVEANGVEASSLTMRRPKVRDQLAAERGGGLRAEVEVRLFANLCEVPDTAIEGLDMSDYRKLTDAYEDFLSRK